MNRLEISVCILLLSVFISSVSQIILKKAAGKVYDSTLKEYLNPMVIGAYAMFFCSVILTMIPEMLRELSDYRMLIYAIVLIVMMLFNWAPKAIEWREKYLSFGKKKKEAVK